MTAHRVKAILGYDLADGVTTPQFEQWLWEVHVPDLQANPFLTGLVFNTVVRPITKTSSGSPTTAEPQTFYRITELHFDDHEGYESYLSWFVDNPIPSERGPAGRMSIKFYVLTDSLEVTAPA